MKRIFITINLLILFFISSAQAGESREVTLVHFNDTYTLEAVKRGKQGGIDRVATVLERYKAPPPFILFSGDAFGSGSKSMFMMGKQMVAGFNKLGVNVAVVGNHEFDFGYPNAVDRIAESKFNWLGANLMQRDGKAIPKVGTYDVYTWHGVKIGVVGLVDNWVNVTSAREDLSYKDFIPVAKEALQEFKKQNVDLAIALTHMDLENDRKLANEVKGFDLILGGHDHHPIEEKVNGAMLWKSGSDFMHLGIFRIKILSSGEKQIMARLQSINDKIEPQPAMQAFVKTQLKEYEQKMADMGAQVLATTLVELSAKRADVRSKEGPLGNLIADAIKDNQKSDIAIMNGGGIRSDFVYPKGKITLKDAAAILPFPNIVVTIKMTGAQIKEALEFASRKLPDQNGGFLHVAGLKYKVDSKKEVGNRVNDIQVNGKPINMEQSYKVGTNDYIAGGGDGYDIMKKTTQLTKSQNGKSLLQVFADYLKSQKKIESVELGRIQKI